MQSLCVSNDSKFELLIPCWRLCDGRLRLELLYNLLGVSWSERATQPLLLTSAVLCKETERWGFLMSTCSACSIKT
eukprot:768772-Hanusia_phi.AAC.10